MVYVLTMCAKIVIFSISNSGPVPTFGAPRGVPATISTSMRFIPGCTRDSYKGFRTSESSGRWGVGGTLVLLTVTKVLNGRWITLGANVGTICRK